MSVNADELTWESYTVLHLAAFYSVYYRSGQRPFQLEAVWVRGRFVFFWFWDSTLTKETTEQYLTGSLLNPNCLSLTYVVLTLLKVKVTVEIQLWCSVL